MTSDNDSFDAESPCTEKIREMLGAWLQAHLVFHALQFSRMTCVEYEQSMGQAWETADFMRHYVAHMMIDGDSDASKLKRIQRFLHLQSGEPEPPYRVQFQGPAIYRDITVRIEAIRDLDFADVHGITEFTDFDVIRVDGRKWTQRAADALVKEIIADLEFDGSQAHLKMQVAGNVLSVQATIQD